MNQFFKLCIAAETIAIDAEQLGVTVEDLQHICINVSAQIIRQPALYLQLTYQVTLPSQVLADQLNWPMWQQAQVRFDDYLWEETCLECFIAGRLIDDHKTAPYIEINANPDGRYALYQFEGYRNPATLPPIPLHTAEGQRASIAWTDNIKPALSYVENPLPNDSSVANKPHYYERSFGVPMTQLLSQQYVIANTVIERIHPCVILWFGEIALYFASSHSSPPDFHNRNHWLRFEL